MKNLNYNILFPAILSCVLFILSGLNHASAQDVIPTKGKEFWVGFMENFEVNSEERLDLFITSNVNTSGTVTIPQQGWTLDFSVVANTTTTVNIPNNLAEHFNENEVISDKGVLVETADTVSVFAINFDPFTADGTKVLPTKSLGTNYRISAYPGLPGSTQYGSSLLIVATEDDTEVEITPSVATTSGNPAGVPFIVQLQRGESYQLLQGTVDSDLTGTTVRGTEANGECRPFAVFSGASCVNVPANCGACDHVYEQNFSVDTWGNEFYIVPYSFASSYTYRILADTDNTDFVINGGAPITLNAGEFQEFNNVSDPICVVASQPASVIQFMEGTSCAGTGDPAMLILNDLSQRIDNVTFSTVVSPNLNDHGLNVIINTNDVGTFSLDGALIDPSEFTPFPSCPTQSYAQLDITTGSHILNAANGFTAYAFGLGDAESYSYSVGSFSPNPFGDIDIQDAVCSSDQVVLGTNSGGFNPFWLNVDFPEDTLSYTNSLVLDPPIASGVYSVTYGNLISGCLQDEYFSVEIPEPPAISISPDETICQYENVQLSVVPDPFNSFYSYTWSPQIGLSNPSIANPIASPLATTEYEVLVESPTGCSSNTETVTITVQGGTFSNIEASADVLEICQGETIQCQVDIDEVIFEDNFDPGVSWGLWEEIENGAQSDVCGSVSGNALYFDGTGNRTAETISTDVSAGGSVSFALQFGQGTAPCDAPENGEDVVLEYSTNGVNWDVLQTYFAININGWQQFSINIPMAAQSATTSFRWRQLANSGTGEDNWSIDNVAISTLTNSALDYNWFPATGLDFTDIANPIATPMEDITYYVEITDNNADCTYLDSLVITVGQSFTLDITPDIAVCDVEGIQLEVIPSIVGNYSYEWDANPSLSSVFSANPVATPTSTTTYEVDVVSEFGCSASAETTITVNQLLDVQLSAVDDELCFGEETLLLETEIGDTSGLSFEWSPALTLDDETLQNPTATPTETTIYTLVVTDDGSGCQLTDEIEIEVSGNFSVDLPEDTLVCDVSGLLLEPLISEPGNYIWSWTPSLDVATPSTQNTEVLLNESNIYTVSASIDGCTQTAEIDVTVLFQNFDLGADVEICDGEEFTIDTGFEDEQHIWNTTDETSSIVVTEEGLYEVEIISDLGCSATDNIFVTVLDLPALDLGDDLSLCEGETAVLNSGLSGLVYEWNTTEATQSISVTESETYSVTVTDADDCQSSDEITVVFNVNPVLNLPEEVSICEDEFVTLDGENLGSTYEWTPNAETSQLINVNESGLYTVEVINQFNCTVTDQTIVSVFSYPTLDLGPARFACDGDTVNLAVIANENENVLWSTNSSALEISVFNSGTYQVTLDNEFCFSTDEVLVTFNPLPVYEEPSFLTTCFFLNLEPIFLDATNLGATYLWDNGSTLSIREISQVGTYMVDITTDQGCTESFETIVEDVCPGNFLFVPNSFTPNNDGINDTWKAQGSFIQEYHVQIYNRWGEIIYESFDIEDKWQGNDQNGDYFVPTGVYTYRIRYKHISDENGNVTDWIEKLGQVTLVR
ncbi:MAG: gliding motility-associated C-terminal domain-containing protein [Flavobacteriales bacterium]